MNWKQIMVLMVSVLFCCLLQFGGPQEQHVPRGPPLLGDEMWAQVHQVGAS